MKHVYQWEVRAQKSQDRVPILQQNMCMELKQKLTSDINNYFARACILSGLTYSSADQLSSIRAQKFIIS